MAEAPASPAHGRLARWMPWLVPLLFAILGAGLYANSLGAPFYYDDLQNIVINQGIQLEELTLDGLREAAVSYKPTRAMAYVTFALNWYFGGDDVTGYHVVNIAIHVINACLVFWLIRLTLQLPAVGYAPGEATLVAFLVALLWLVNPVQTQTVTYIVQRWNSLAVLFYLAAFLCYVHARLAASPGRRWLLFTACGLAAVLAFFTKENTAVLPFFILLYEWFFLQDLRAGWLRRRFLPIVGVLLVFVAIVLVYTDHYSTYRALFAFELPEYDNRWFTVAERLLTEPRVVLFYLTLLLYPVPTRLNLDHDFPLSYSWWNPPDTVFAILALTALFAVAILAARRHRLAAFCILWFLGHLVMESSFIGLEIIYEHRTYLPSIGAFLLLVVLVFRTQIPRPVLTAGFCLLAVLWSAWTVQRNAVWADPRVFWEDVQAKSPGILRSYHALAVLDFNEGRYAVAEAGFGRAIAVHEAFKTRPTAARPVRMTTLDWIQAHSHYQRGRLLLDRDALAEAEADFSRAIEIAGRKLIPARLYRGITHQLAGDNAAALTDYSKVIKLKPRHYEARHYRGDLYRVLGDYEAAAKDYRRMTKLRPDDPEAHLKLGGMYIALGRDSQARQALETALAVAPVEWKWRDRVRLQLKVLEARESREPAP